MRRLLFLMAAATMLLTACKDKKTAGSEIITTDYEAPQPQAPIAMGAQTDRTADVEWGGGRPYTVQVTRTPVDSLPMVTDEIGQKYIDNAIRVEVTRADSSVFFNRTFTKSAFVGWLDGDYRKKAILEGISFQKAEGNALLFVAWLNYPTSGEDEAVELQLSVSRQGDVAIDLFDENDRDDLMQQDGED